MIYELRIYRCVPGRKPALLSRFENETLRIALGDKFDGDKVKAYPPGCVVILPGDTPHFHWAKSGEYITQVTAIGPLGLEYMNSKDDPRNKSSSHEQPA